MAERGGGVKTLWELQARRFALWVPVLMGLGVYARFFWAEFWLLSVLCVSVAGVVRRGRVLFAVMAFVAGACAADMRIRLVDAPVLSDVYRGEVKGRIIAVDRSRSGAPRVTLDGVQLDGVLNAPVRVRLTLTRKSDVPEAGQWIKVRAVLAAPPGPPEPGSFDFSRQAYFKRLGAVGYSTSPASLTVLPLDGWQVRVEQMRGRVASAVRERIGGPQGAVAAALIVGDRSGIPEETRQALRDSGLAHLLAISGLHMGLLSALVFWVVRLGLSLVPTMAERIAIRKVAAVAALGAALIYLIMSGASVATQRAFVMASVVFVAILLDRVSVTMRGLAVAACLILLLRPESLFEAGFQMSFGAVVALVATYEATRSFWKARAARKGVAVWFGTAVMATIMTSTVAGIATAPFAAYHFNRLVLWGLPANLLATPLMGLWIMPCVILAAFLAPFGLAGWALGLLGVGIGYILFVAELFAGLEGAVNGIAAGRPWALAAIVFGGLWMAIWRGRIRLLGIVSVLMGGIFWHDQRPDLFIAKNAQLIGARGEDGQLWISRARAEAYAGDMWLRRDGDKTVDRAEAWQRREWQCNKRRCRGWTTDDWRVVFLRTGNPSRSDCAEKTILIAPHLSASDVSESGCFVVSNEHFQQASSLTLHIRGADGPLIRAARSWQTPANSHPE